MTDAPISPRRELAKGFFGALPVLGVLLVFAASMDAITQWGASREYEWTSFQNMLLALFWSAVFAFVGFASAVVFFWRRSRWISYGILAAIGGLVLLGGGFLMLLIAAIPKGD